MSSLLRNIIQEDVNKINKISRKIANRELGLINCSGVETIPPEKLKALFSELPEDWKTQWGNVSKFIDVNTINENLVRQIKEYQSELKKDIRNNPYTTKGLPQTLLPYAKILMLILIPLSIFICLLIFLQVFSCSSSISFFPSCKPKIEIKQDKI